ncbi:MAG: hypothetical protein ABIN01_03810 [Ferruginibacter sp.]
MSYSQDEGHRYEIMLSNLRELERIKKKLSGNKCIVHKKSVKIEANYEFDYSIQIVITKCCCNDFGKIVAEHFHSDISNDITIILQ